MPDPSSHDFLPLAGLSIVTLAINLPGPAAAGRLRDLGASVTKIEPPDGDPLARGCPEWYRALHEHVTVLRLDLKVASDRERLNPILAQSDLLLTSSRPAALERLGLSWSEVHRQFPRLCQVAIIGHAPPDEHQPGHDLTYQATLGLVSPPEMPRALIADLGGAEEAVSTAVSLLLAREREATAAYAQVSLAEAAARFALPYQYGLTRPAGLLGGGWPGYNLYRATDGWIAVAALEPHFAERLRSKLGIESFTHEALETAFGRQSAAEWEAWATTRDLPIVAVRP
ncbi:MAG TPA: CaiB/BaiF CoA-transferase family protein [Planctomycetaceae bacterium]|jgi:crotonobetainyl-CoA:carnitine CoA-transferase CaiB-like acyl-CoA transferase|nr:CaiB/BaiF CoA-transferase family protein [Planctomycetaceae bacterium]